MTLSLRIVRSPGGSMERCPHPGPQDPQLESDIQEGSSLLLSYKCQVSSTSCSRPHSLESWTTAPRGQELQMTLPALPRISGVSLGQIHRQHISPVLRLQGRGQDWALTPFLAACPLVGIGFPLWELPKQVAVPGTRVYPTRPWSEPASHGGRIPFWSQWCQD